MPVRRVRPFAAGAIGGALTVLFATSVAAQITPTGRLGLSAAPDAYVDTISPEVGEEFTLHVILTGMTAEQPLPFDLDTVQWAVFTACCGDSPVQVTSIEYAPGLQSEGDPYEAMTSTAVDCLEGATIRLATVHFDWAMDGESDFLLSAGSLTGALDCEGEGHLLSTITVAVHGQPDQTPVDAASWSDLKAWFPTEDQGGGGDDR